jgi:tRNA G18 (ribose-2'-O)-methylase SpoU
MLYQNENDQMANLGGLARTCEVFGATMAIENKAVLQNKVPLRPKLAILLMLSQEFLQKSMTAERSLKTEMAPKESLPKYLASLKERGFVVVGAEQVGLRALLLSSSQRPDVG